MKTAVKEQRTVVSQYEGESTEQSKRVRSGCTKSYSKFIIPTHQRKHNDTNEVNHSKYTETWSYIIHCY